MDIVKAEYLLNQVGGLLKSYEKLAKSTGENFNIFSIMGMESDEVKTHSRIIAELLNPKGSHSQGSVFLKYFFEEIEELKSIEIFDFDNAKVIVEQHIGIINSDYTTGGYIDIVIKDERNKIEVVIENKIYATDQKGQLLRYKNHYKNCKLIYLTLDRKKPSIESYCHLDPKININLEDIILICYKDKIICWIDRCHKEAIQQPMLREMLKQYSNLLKKLTNQTINNELKMDISDLIKNNFLEASEIANNFENAKNTVVTDFWEKIEKELDKQLKGKWVVKNGENLIKSRFNHILISRNYQEDIYFYCRYDHKYGDLNLGIILNPERNKTKIKGNEIWAVIKNNTDSTLNFKTADQSVIWQEEKEFNFSDLRLLSKIFKEASMNRRETLDNFTEKVIKFIELNKDLYVQILEYTNQKNQ